MEEVPTTSPEEEAPVQPENDIPVESEDEVVTNFEEGARVEKRVSPDERRRQQQDQEIAKANRDRQIRQGHVKAPGSEVESESQPESEE